MTLVIGEISYTNILPIFYYVDRQKLSQLGCTFIPKIPAKLNQDMAEGRIDVGGISSFAYGENADAYTVLPNLSVSSFDSVGSIFLFSKYPIEQLDGKRIALTSSSATSSNLLKIILGTFMNHQIAYDVMEPNFQKMMATYDAALLIGDDAIVTSWNEGNHYYRYDLGELWYKYTALPMTFAVFAVRNQVIVEKEEMVAELYDQLVTSKDESIEQMFKPMIADIQKLLGGPTSYWTSYFNGLSYDLGQKQIEGLLYYFKLAYEKQLITTKVEQVTVWSAYDRHHTIS
ncbi:menaquinone biosynthesis protein [Bacillus alkalicellulosilyticus]|uniref:menaquinone biosynthesis protein n=1 Tax=Alkalihalobacterium alkalicellulosilyticum TaxID=1912214 RepID=UPI0009960802|nr:menaquinone biosynthesis protein [Bacillus alkalicellulosilyticus]